MAINMHEYGLMNLYEFIVFKSREEYERLMGEACPEWDATRNPKYWMDHPLGVPDVEGFHPMETTEKVNWHIECLETVNGVKKIEINQKFVTYPRALAVNQETGEPLAGKDGKPFLDKFTMTRELAERVNIPPEGVGNGMTPIPVPCRKLDEGESLEWGSKAAEWVVVVNSRVEETPEDSGLDAMLQEKYDAEIYQRDHQPEIYTVRDKMLLEKIASKLGVV